MSITFKSAGHFLATFFKAVYHNAPAEIEGVEVTKNTVDTVLSLIPGVGVIAETGADLAYAALGEIGQVIALAGTAGSAKLADAGIDQSVITAIEAAIKGMGGLGAFLGSLVPKPVTA